MYNYRKQVSVVLIIKIICCKSAIVLVRVFIMYIMFWEQIHVILAI